MVKLIRFESAPVGHRMSCRLHLAACDSTMVYCRGTGATPPAGYFTSDHLLYHQTRVFTFPDLTVWSGTW